MSTLILEVRDELARLVEATARDRRTTPSEVVSECIESKLGIGELPPGTSLHDLTKDLIGNYSGPSDLATNPRYLDDLGK